MKKHELAFTIALVVFFSSVTGYQLGDRLAEKRCSAMLDKIEKRLNALIALRGGHNDPSGPELPKHCEIGEAFWNTTDEKPYGCFLIGENKHEWRVLERAQP
jgi:hypothetical protein